MTQNTQRSISDDLAIGAGLLLISPAIVAIAVMRWHELVAWAYAHHLLVSHPLVSIPGTPNLGLDAARLVVLVGILSLLVFVGYLVLRFHIMMRLAQKRRPT